MKNYTLVLSISGIKCNACLKLITQKLGEMDGVKEVTIEGLEGNTTITSSQIINLSDIADVLAGTQYKISTNNLCLKK